MNQPDPQSFIAAAEHPQPKLIANTPIHTSFAWLDSKVRDDVIKSINLRLPEPYILKLQYIAEHTPKSQQKFIKELLCPAIDKEIERIVQGRVWEEELKPLTND